MKAVFLDTIAECTELRKQLKEEGIACKKLMLGLEEKKVLRKAIEEFGVSAKDCLLITNREEHATAAQEIGMICVGCVEGVFPIPKSSVLIEELEEISAGYLKRIFAHAKGLPAPIFETSRLLVRELSPEDADCLYEICKDKEVRRFLTDEFGSKEEEREKLLAYIQTVYPFFELAYWGVYEKGSGELIGKAGFREGSFPLEIGYVLRKDRWGQGIATELVKGICDYVRNEFDIPAEQLIAHIVKGNEASVHVAQKNGIYVQTTVLV